MSKDESVQRLQLIEQNVQALNMQKQQFQGQLFELDAALKELETAPSAFKLIGGLLISVPKQTLQSDLKQRRDMFDVRLQTLDKQEAQLKEKAKKLQAEVLKE